VFEIFTESEASVPNNGRKRVKARLKPSVPSIWNLYGVGDFSSEQLKKRVKARLKPSVPSIWNLYGVGDFSSEQWKKRG
jgi:hypothetical protein